VCKEDCADPLQIKNHYHKLASEGKNLDIVQKANEATHRRNRGDAIGPPPVPTQPPKRRYDPIQTPIPRTLAPNTEVVDLENSPLQSALPLQASPPQFAPQSRFPAQPPAARQSNAAPEARAHQDPVIPAQNTAPRPNHPAGPRMGFFAEDARPVVPQQPAHQATQQPPRPAPNQNETQTQRIARIKTEHDNNPTRHLFTHPPGPTLAEQEADRERERVRAERDLVLQQQQQQQHQNQSQRALQDTRSRLNADFDARPQLEPEERDSDHIRQRQPQPTFFRPAGGQMPPSMYPHHVSSEPGRAEQRFSQPQFSMQVAPISSASKPIVDLTGSSTQQPQSRPFSPPLRTVRPPSPARAPPAPNPPPQRTMTPTPAPAPAVPAKEPPKRVNIMSMLNPEPEEERPRRREPETMTPVSSGTPAQQYRPQLPPSESGPPREPFGEPRPFSRPTFPPAQHTPGSSVSTPTSESAPRDGLPSMSHRDSWPGPRPAFQGLPMQQRQQQHPVGSPLSQPQHGPSMPEPRGSLFNQDYRSATFSSLNQARHVPSPPPASGAYSHSRTPSYTQNAPAQHPTQPSASSIVAGAGLVRQNPYARKDGPPAPSSQPHLHGSQVVQAQNEVNYGHSRYAHNEPPPQDTRREAMFDRFRERPSEAATREQRDREQQHREQMLVQQQHQHRYGGHHTPPVTQPHYAPPERSGPTPLSHPAYAPPSDVGHLQHPDSRSQQQLEYHAELRRRDYERERQRQERMETEARNRSIVQQQNQQRLYEDRMRQQHAWEPGPGSKQ
jgi:hypothetical protein